MMWRSKGRFRFPFRGHVLRLLIIIVWMMILCGWVYIRKRPIRSYMDENSFKYIIEKVYAKNPLVKSENIHSTAYVNWLKEYDVGDIVRNADFHERCDAYFERLYNQKEKNIINPHRGFSFDREMYKSFEEFREHRIGRWKENKQKEREKRQKEEQKKAEQKKNNGGAKRAIGLAKHADKEAEGPIEPDEKVEEEIRNEYKKGWEKIRVEEQIIHDYVSHVRIFNKCYVTFDSNEDNVKNGMFIDHQKSFSNSIRSNKVKSKVIKERKKRKAKKANAKSAESFPSCDDLQKRVYPWLTGNYPKFEKWDGSLYEFPVFTKKIFDHKKVKSTSKFVEKEGCFLNEYRRRLNGKGIVLTVADGHLDLTIRLIRLLRSLGNELPIEIVYHSGLSDESKRQLVAASTSKYQNHPTQELWFVDVNYALDGDYKNKFDGFGNKILATMFNSFEEMLLIDADSVLLENPKYFFSLPKYQRTGTMFYKDRSTVEFRPQSDLKFFHKLMPSQLDTMLFNIPQVTNRSLETEFFKGLNHYMESGLVVMNRGRHFSQALMMSQLNFHLPIQARVYGDKELFWLAHVFLGDEEYSFNEHFAAAIGFSTPQQERMIDAKRAKDFESKEICSNHPAHINDEDHQTLLWFNSGFRHCGKHKRVNFPSEFKVRKRYTHLKSLTQFETFFKDKVIIKEAIIPPHSTFEAKNDVGEPDRSWINLREYCSGYTWCAYSQIGGEYTNPDDQKTHSNVDKGIHIQFTEEQIAKFERLGDVWISDYDYRTKEQIEKDEQGKQADINGENEEMKFRVDKDGFERILKDKQKVNEDLDQKNTPKNAFWDILY